MSYSKIIVHGRLGSNAETQTGKTGTVMTKFTLAVNSGYGDKQKTTWFDVTFFGDRWQKVMGQAKKGSEVILDGELSVYEPTDPSKKMRLQITGQSFSFVGGRPSGGGGGHSGRGVYRDSGIDDNDVPF